MEDFLFLLIRTMEELNPPNIYGKS